MEPGNNSGKNLHTLDGCRDEIDRIDEEIVSLLLRRQDIAARIGQIKRTLAIKTFDPNREKDVLRRVRSRSNENLTEEAISHIFNEIVSAARSVQNRLPEASIREMEGHCSYMKQLGSFPSGDDPWD